MQIHPKMDVDKVLVIYYSQIAKGLDINSFASVALAKQEHEIVSTNATSHLFSA